jgi:hypothetical protein
MKLVIIESPYAGDVKRNLLYLDYCIRDCLSRVESPIASHKMFTTALDDNAPAERGLGILAGLAWRAVPGVTPVFYEDLDWSSGMRAARNLYDSEGRMYVIRTLPKHDLKNFLEEAE